MIWAVLGADGQDALFATLAHDHDALVLEVDVAQAEVAELGGADAGVDEQGDDGPVAESGGPAVGAAALAGAGVVVGAVAGGEHGLDVALGVGDDFALLGSGRVDVADDVAGRRCPL